MTALEDKLLVVQAAINNALTLDMDPVVVLQAGDAVVRQAKHLSITDIPRVFECELAARLKAQRGEGDQPPPVSPPPLRDWSVEQLRTDAPFLHPCSCVE